MGNIRVYEDSEVHLPCGLWLKAATAKITFILPKYFTEANSSRKPQNWDCFFLSLFSNHPCCLLLLLPFGLLVLDSLSVGFTVHRQAFRTQPSHLGVVSVDNDLGRKPDNEHALTNNQSTLLGVHGHSTDLIVKG